MPGDVVDDPKAELALVEDEVADAVRQVDDLRRELGSRSDGAGDPVDDTTLIEQLNAAESLLEDLRSRRSELRRRLGSAGPQSGITNPDP